MYEILVRKTDVDARVIVLFTDAKHSVLYRLFYLNL